MQTVRNDLLSVFTRTVQLLSNISFPLPSSNLTAPTRNGGKVVRGRLVFLEKFADWLKKPKNRKRAFLVVWLVLVFLLFILTAGLIFGSHRVAGGYRPGIAISTFLWAFFFGVWILFALPAKAITALFGGLAATGINELGSSTGLISRANKWVTDIATQVGMTVGQPDTSTDYFIAAMVWLFFGVLIITSLPAFFRDK